jgi:hypothetical protein
MIGPSLKISFGPSTANGVECAVIMPAEPPDSSVVNRAIDIYLDRAYGSERPVAVSSMVSTLRNWGGKFYACPVFVKDGETPPKRYSMRLGNRHYPHMKLVIERAPDGETFLFRADTHDRHVCPPEGAAEHDAFVNLMTRNQEIAQAVDSAWAEQGIPTFKTWLREDLARREKQ